MKAYFGYADVTTEDLRLNSQKYSLLIIGLSRSRSSIPSLQKLA
jgi:hypothetical protein